MALRGKQPDAVQKRLKMLMYGNAGAGKTTAAISFPSPYLIDTEKGAENSQYVELLIDNGGVRFQTTDFNEVLQEVKALLTEDHPYKTLVIDSLTVLYHGLLEEAAKVVGTDYGKNRGPANRAIKSLLSLLLRLDMNVIITAHSKKEYSKKMDVVGNTYDCYDKLDYLFDLVIEIEKLGKTRTGIVRKTRIKTFDEYEEFEFSYVNIARKYGADILEKKSVNIKLADAAQLEEMGRLTTLLKTSVDVVERWCAKAACDSLEEMDFDTMAKCILHLQGQAKGKEGK